jgi:hypothetical protein
MPEGVPDYIGYGPIDPRMAALRCAEKTARENVYRDKRYAKAKASQMRRATGEPKLMSFRCHHCGKYHLGKRKPPQSAEDHGG